MATTFLGVMLRSGSPLTTAPTGLPSNRLCEPTHAASIQSTRALENRAFSSRMKSEPYSTSVSEREIHVFGANRTGLERRGFASERVETLQKAFRLLSRAGLNTSQAVERIRAEIDATPELDELLAFIAASERGFVK